MIPRRSTTLVLTILCLTPLTWFASANNAVHADEPEKAQPFYIGTYTRGDSEGIYLSYLDPKDGSLTKPVLAAKLDNPSFLAINKDSTNLYAAGEVANFKDKDSGAVSAFAFNKDGTLKLLNQEASGGKGPCHVILGPDEATVIVANYGGGSFASLPLTKEGQLKPAATVIQQTGSSINERRQKGPHAHGTYLVPGTKMALGVDLGIDKVMIFNVQKDGALTANNPAYIAVQPGSGPRHLATSDSGERVYVLNELASTIDVYSFDPKTGANQHLQNLSTLPDDFDGSNTTAEIFIHPNGKWLYASNRGHDSIAAFAIDAKSGKLTALGQVSSQGETPRSFQIGPHGKYLLVANQNTSNIVSYTIDPQQGTLKATGHEIKVPNPCCIDFRFD